MHRGSREEADPTHHTLRALRVGHPTALPASHQPPGSFPGGSRMRAADVVRDLVPREWDGPPRRGPALRDLPNLGGRTAFPLCLWPLPNESRGSSYPPSSFPVWNASIPRLAQRGLEDVSLVLSSLPGLTRPAEPSASDRLIPDFRTPCSLKSRFPPVTPGSVPASLGQVSFSANSSR